MDWSWVVAVLALLCGLTSATFGIGTWWLRKYPPENPPLKLEKVIAVLRIVTIVTGVVTMVASVSSLIILLK